eukprot:1796245-Rhodomonas_salina.1
MWKDTGGMIGLKLGNEVPHTGQTLSQLALRLALRSCLSASPCYTEAAVLRKQKREAKHAQRSDISGVLLGWARGAVLMIRELLDQERNNVNHWVNVGDELMFVDGTEVATLPKHGLHRLLSGEVASRWAVGRPRR